MNFLNTSAFARQIEATEKLRQGTHQVVHYTSGQNALNIINGEEFWLRNVRCMNDFREVEHGIGLLVDALANYQNGVRRDRLISAIDKIAPGIALETLNDFDAWSDILRHQTFIGCLSLIESADNLGKLSMWRAYCPKDAGVAIVMKPTPFLAETDVLGAYSIPVSYLSDEQFAAEMDIVLEAIEEEINKVGDISDEEKTAAKSSLLWLLLAFALGTKHPAFEEEQEWRIFAIPEMFPSQTIRQEVESIAGIPQIVQKIPLLNAPDKGLHGASISSLVDRLIIGPTDYPLVIRDALAKALESKGVKDPEKKIFFSNIPLR